MPNTNFDNLRKVYNDLLSANEDLKISNQEYSRIDEIVKMAEEQLDINTKYANDITHKLTSKHHLIWRMKNPEAIKELNYYMNREKNIEELLEPYRKERHELMMKQEPLMIVHSCTNAKYETRCDSMLSEIITKLRSKKELPKEVSELLNTRFTDEALRNGLTSMTKNKIYNILAPEALKQ